MTKWLVVIRVLIDSIILRVFIQNKLTNQLIPAGYLHIISHYVTFLVILNIII